MTSESGVAAVALRHRFCLRALEVVIESSSPAIHRAASCLVNHGDDSDAIERTVRFRLSEQEAGRVDVVEDDYGFRAPSLPAALALVHRRLGNHLHSVYERYTVLHAGAVTIDGRLIVVAGHRGAGKTTLLIRLALDGATFHGDEYVAAGRDGVARTLPRRLHVKPGTLICLPEIEATCRAYPMLVLDGGVLFYPLDLVDLGISWRGVSARPSAIVHLVPAFDEAPAVTPIAQIESVRQLMREAQGTDLDFGRQAADITGVVRGVPCYEVRVGDLVATAEEIRRIATTVPCA